MTTGFSWSFNRIIFRICLGTLAFFCGAVSEARAERILDLQFWSSEQSALALGGLWEFHAQTLLEPGQRRLGSELFLDVSQPWRDFQTLSPTVEGPLERGSYVLLVKGLKPRRQGYALQVTSPQSMTRMIIAPKYAPERAQRVQTEGPFAVFPMLRSLVGPRLKLVFMPGALDEIWMIIVQRWQTPRDAKGSVPRLELAEKSL